MSLAIQTTKTPRSVKKKDASPNRIRNFIVANKETQTIQILKGKTFHEMEVPTQALQLFADAIENYESGYKVSLRIRRGHFDPGSGGSAQCLKTLPGRVIGERQNSVSQGREASSHVC